MKTSSTLPSSTLRLLLTTTNLDILSGQAAAVPVGLGEGEGEHLHLVTQRLTLAKSHLGEGVGAETGCALTALQSQRLKGAVPGRVS